jgi:hypothetical protein
LLDELLHLVGERLPEVADLTLNIGWLGDQPVHRDDHDQGRYERQERVESDPSRHKREVVLAQAPGQLLRDLLRGSGRPARHTRQNTSAAQRPP